MTLFKLFILSFLLGGFAQASEAPVQTFRIFMVLWNGPTDLEKGFLAYLKHKKVRLDLEVRDCEGDRSKCHALISDIRKFKPDLIYTWGTPACEEIAGKLNQSKKNYIWDIPIVSLVVTDPVTANIIESLDAPGRNVTGVNHVAPVCTQLKTIMMYRRCTKTIAAIYNPDETNSVLQVNELKKTAKGVDIILLPLATIMKKPSIESISQQVDKAASQKVDFIYIPTDTFLSLHADKLVEAANHRKIPTFAATESMYWNAKPMLGVFSSFINVGTFGGFKAYEILMNNKDVATIPYEKLSRYSVVISKPTYEKVGLTPPIKLLKFAEVRG
ncbi:MAG: ABC transporter substrate-binding protein [Alphaproteobacteria bacterium]|nr:ABC transporter substrate-binding protein [Alphaproteobacteria bacterium]